MREKSGDQVAAELRRLGVGVIDQDNEGIKIMWDDAEILLRILLEDEDRAKQEFAQKSS